MRHAEFRAIDAHSQASVPKWCHDSSFLPDPIGWVGEQRKQTKAVGKSLMSPVHDALLSPARPKVRICKESYGAPFPGCLKRGWSAFGAFFHKRGGRSPVDDPLCRVWSSLRKSHRVILVLRRGNAARRTASTTAGRGAAAGGLCPDDGGAGRGEP